MAFKSFPQGAFPDCFAQKTLLPSFQEAPDLPPNISLYTHTHTHTHTHLSMAQNWAQWGSRKTY